MAIDHDFQGQIWFKQSNLLVSPLLEIHNHHITTTESWVPRLLHRLTVSWFRSSLHTYIPRLFHGPDCFTVSTRCTHTDLDSRVYFGVYRRTCLKVTYCPKLCFHSGLTLGWYHQPIRSPHWFWLTVHNVLLETLGAGGLADVPHKCTRISFFCKVNNILKKWTSFLTDALAVFYCLAISLHTHVIILTWVNLP